MSKFDYEVSKTIASEDPPFNALIMAAMWKGDSLNRSILESAYPDVWKELWDRYNAPGGVLPGERVPNE